MYFFLFVVLFLLINHLHLHNPLQYKQNFYQSKIHENELYLDVQMFLKFSLLEMLFAFFLVLILLNLFVLLLLKIYLELNVLILLYHNYLLLIILILCILMRNEKLNRFYLCLSFIFYFF